MTGPDRSGLWAQRLTVRRIVIDPVDVLVDLAAAEAALWSWWAARTGLDGQTAADVGRRRPLAAALAHLAADGDDADAVAAVRARRAALHRLARRRRGAAALLRSIPAGRAAVWTTLEEDELAALERRARLRLPEARRCALPLDDTDGAGRFLAGLGTDPGGWLALESHAAGVARSARLGCRVVQVTPAGGTDAVGPAAAAGAGVDLRVEDPALLSVTPDADGLAVGVRRQARLRPGRRPQA